MAEKQSTVQRILVWIGTHERSTMLALLFAAAALWAFVEIADEVTAGDTITADERLLLAFRTEDDLSDPMGPRWVEEMARDITGLGGVGILTFLTLASVAFLALRGNRRTALYLLLAIGSGIAISMLLKAGFARPRPDLVPHGSYVYTSSFPSGHSMMSAITYLTLGAVLAGAQSSRRLKAFFLVVAGILTVTIGISRVYLGVHWPTDVLGGWTAGAGWAFLCWAVAQRLRREHKIEASD